MIPSSMDLGFADLVMKIPHPWQAQDSWIDPLKNMLIYRLDKLNIIKLDSIYLGLDDTLPIRYLQCI